MSPRLVVSRAAEWLPASPRDATAPTILQAETDSIPSAYEMGCEPFLLHDRRTAPRYDSIFVGQGKDRIS